MIVVVCAVTEELRGFTRDGVDVVAVGIGPIEAALGTTRLLAGRRYRSAVNAGIGGGFSGRAAVGDAVVVRAETYVDLGREDRTTLNIPGGVQLIAKTHSDPALLERLTTSRVTELRFGTGVTSATITTSDARAAQLAELYAPHVESMEGFAVLRAATLTGIPAIELRGISNIVGDRERAGWDFRAGAAAAVHALETFCAAVEAQA